MPEDEKKEKGITETTITEASVGITADAIKEAEDEFDKAFEEAISEPAETLDKEETPETQQQEDTPAEEVQEDITDQPSDGVFLPTPAEDPDSTDKGKQTANPDDDQDYKALYEAEKQKTSSWAGRINAANKRAEEAESKLKELGSQQTTETDKGQSPGEDTLPKGDDDEEKELSEFIEEFPSLKKPIELLAKKIARKIVDDELQTLRPQVESVAKSVQQTSAKTHADMITEAHPDWVEIRDSGELHKWFDAQPSFLRASLLNVYQDGSTEEVIEMFTSYKKANGVQSKPNPETLEKDLEPNPPKKKAEDLLAVPAQSGGPPKDKKKVDKNDFDSAWAEANSK